MSDACDAKGREEGEKQSEVREWKAEKHKKKTKILEAENEERIKGWKAIAKKGSLEKTLDQNKQPANSWRSCLE